MEQYRSFSANFPLALPNLVMESVSFAYEECARLKESCISKYFQLRKLCDWFRAPFPIVLKDDVYGAELERLQLSSQQIFRILGFSIAGASAESRYAALSKVENVPHPWSNISPDYVRNVFKNLVLLGEPATSKMAGTFLYKIFSNLQFYSNWNDYSTLPSEFLKQYFAAKPVNALSSTNIVSGDVTESSGNSGNDLENVFFYSREIAFRMLGKISRDGSLTVSLQIMRWILLLLQDLEKGVRHVIEKQARPSSGFELEDEEDEPKMDVCLLEWSLHLLGQAIQANEKLFSASNLASLAPDLVEQSSAKSAGGANASMAGPLAGFPAGPGRWGRPIPKQLVSLLLHRSRNSGEVSLLRDLGKDGHISLIRSADEDRSPSSSSPLGSSSASGSGISTDCTARSESPLGPFSGRPLLSLFSVLAALMVSYRHTVSLIASVCRVLSGLAKQYTEKDVLVDVFLHPHFAKVILSTCNHPEVLIRGEILQMIEILTRPTTYALADVALGPEESSDYLQQIHFIVQHVAAKLLRSALPGGSAVPPVSISPIFSADSDLCLPSPTNLSSVQFLLDLLTVLVNETSPDSRALKIRKSKQFERVKTDLKKKIESHSVISALLNIDEQSAGEDWADDSTSHKELIGVVESSKQQIRKDKPKEPAGANSLRHSAPGRLEIDEEEDRDEKEFLVADGIARLLLEYLFVVALPYDMTFPDDSGFSFSSPFEGGDLGSFSTLSQLLGPTVDSVRVWCSVYRLLSHAHPRVVLGASFGGGGFSAFPPISPALGSADSPVTVREKVLKTFSMAHRLPAHLQLSVREGYTALLRNLLSGPEKALVSSK